MSAPPLADRPAMPTVVSRLPRFGPRAKPASDAAPLGPSAAGTSARLTNGFYHHPGPTAPAARQNGFIRVPTSFSVKWRRGNGATEDGGKGGNLGQHRSANNVPQQHDTKKPTAWSVGRGVAQPVTPSSSPSPQSSPRPLPVPKPSRCGLTNGTEQLLKAKARACLRPPQAFPAGSGPGSGSVSRLKKPPATRSQSTDSLGGSATVRLTEGDRFRSRSLTQVRQQPSPTLTPSSRPNARRLASSPQAPHRGSVAKSLISSRTPEGGAKGGGVKGQSSGVGFTSILPPSALKKPLLRSLAPTSKPSGISYKLSRPSLIKQSRPFRVTSANGCGAKPAAETDTSPDSPAEAPVPEPVGLEDMSLSSTSSLDTSQEYMDDFDNLGADEDDSGLDRSGSRFDRDKTPGLCFLEDDLDWADVRFSGERGAAGLGRLGPSDGHDQGGSSLDLSPSDSCGSGGTYLWDEEGLEPLGGPATSASINTTHHVGSFDSDLNSIDILNNLDSCDLEDDDLMLDADLAEDGSLHSDGGGMSHMAQWRRSQLCWGMQDGHSDGDLQISQLAEEPGNKRTAKDMGLILALCPPRSPSLSPATPGLDVEELAEDCSAVRSQLEILQTLLLQEDDVDGDTVSPGAESPSSDSQVQSLLQEVQQLREELRSRDRTIAQLTLKLAVPTVTTRCCCQEPRGKMDRCTQTSVTERESVASQTPWSDHSVFPPVPFLSPPWQYQRSRPYRGRPRPSIPSHLARQRVEKLVLYFSDTACHRYFTAPGNVSRNH